MNRTKEHYDNSVAEEVSAIGQRVKGAVKDTVGEMTGNRALEREGEHENAEGRTRQANNQVLGERWITGTFNDRDTAEQAYKSLAARGYSKDDINLLMSDETRQRYFTDADNTDLGSKALEGAGAGGAIGGVVGAVLGSIAAIGTSIALPGLGVVIAGPLAAAFAGAGAGGLTGGLIGALIGAGIPEDRARLYENDVQNGRIVMGVKARNDDDAQYFHDEWKKSRANNLYR